MPGFPIMPGYGVRRLRLGNENQRRQRTCIMPPPALGIIMPPFGIIIGF
jgi:hypothetical protein